MSSDLTPALIRQMCGGIDDRDVEAILETGATAADLERALAAADGVEEPFLTGAAAELYALLTRDREFEGDR